MYSSLMVMLNKQNQRVGYEDPPGEPVAFKIFQQNYIQKTGFRRKSQFSGYQNALMLNKQNQRVGYEDPPGEPVAFKIFQQNYIQKTGFRRKSQFSGYQNALPYAIYR